jgi:hypothetical protein
MVVISRQLACKQDGGGAEENTILGIDRIETVGCNKQTAVCKRQAAVLTFHKFEEFPAAIVCAKNKMLEPKAPNGNLPGASLTLAGLVARLFLQTARFFLSMSHAPSVGLPSLPVHQGTHRDRKTNYNLTSAFILTLDPRRQNYLLSAARLSGQPKQMVEEEEEKKKRRAGAADPIFHWLTV